MKTRVFSAALMIIVFIPFLLLGGIPFAIFMAFLSAYALHEVIKVRETRKKFPTVLKLFAYILVLVLCFTDLNTIEFQYNMDYRFLAFIVFLFTSPMVFINDTKKYNLNDALFLVSLVVFIGLSFKLIVITRNFDITYIIYLLLITTITDTFALISGMLVGRHKLCPKISPKKTVEGLIGGVLMGTFVATSFYFTVINSSISLVFLIFITALLCLIGQLGDLVFSSIKRYYDIKDFSNLIPGHGGVLDRFDSLVYVTLAFIILLVLCSSCFKVCSHFINLFLVKVVNKCNTD